MHLDENRRTVAERLGSDSHEDLDLHLGVIAAVGLRNSVLLHERCFLTVEGPSEQQAIPSAVPEVRGTVPASRRHRPLVGSAARVGDTVTYSCSRPKILLEQTDDRYNLAAVLVGLASLARDDGELQESVNHLASAVVIFRDLGRATAMATVVASLALTYYTAGRFPEAAETYRTALAIFVAHKDRGNIARTLANMALTSAEAGDKQQAVRYLEQALAEYDEIGDQHGAAIALENLRKLTE